MQVIIILLLLINIVLVLDISSRIPPRDYVKEAMQRDLDKRINRMNQEKYNNNKKQ